ncbi:serine/threonine protein phosphatase ['Osedax' symbiont bacterium Rs2_46_30_T18]|nr:serine/threonine protein phosphatase ['Osedax' symbiont bacterium Rs2_46_30_T18]
MIQECEAQGYDIIGDVHGCALALKLLLVRLGYSKRNGVYFHPSRKVVFLGDIIDRGPRIREALHLVRDMVDAGNAHIVMGNHEYNYLSYSTSGESVHMPYLREHTSRHQRILQQTLDQLANHPRDQQDFYQWMMKLPVFLEFDSFRVVHACWHKEIIAQMLSTTGGNTIDPEFLYHSAVRDTFEWTVMDRLLRGTQIRLPNNETMTCRDGFVRQFFRTKFWHKSPELYGDVVFQPDPLPTSMVNRVLSKQEQDNLYYYADDEKTLFIGHYWCEGVPAPLTANIACLDYSAVKFGKLVAYRYDFEKVLQADKFVSVDVRTEV